MSITLLYDTYLAITNCKNPSREDAIICPI